MDFMNFLVNLYFGHLDELFQLEGKENETDQTIHQIHEEQSIQST